jgi:copper chaperone CopZ
MAHGMTQLPMAGTGGGCACCSGAGTTTSTTAQNTKEIPVSTQTFPVTGMTCGHCVSAVTEELRQLPGVTEVTVDLVAGGTSSVTVASDSPVSESDVAAALDEAGDYELATR